MKKIPTLLLMMLTALLAVSCSDLECDSPQITSNIQNNRSYDDNLSHTFWFEADDKFTLGKTLLLNGNILSECSIQSAPLGTGSLGHRRDLLSPSNRTYDQLEIVVFTTDACGKQVEGERLTVYFN